MGDRLFYPRKGDEHDVDFSDTTAFALKRWEDAVDAVSQMQSSADRDTISKPRDWQAVHTEIEKFYKTPNTSAITKQLLNRIQPLPRAINKLLGYFIRAISPFETEFNTLWGLLHLNLTESYVSKDKLTKTAGWSKKLRSVIELFNRCLEACEDMNEARLAIVDVLEHTLQILGESVRHLRHCPTDAEANRGWKAIDAKISESLGDMEMVVKHLNDITSYSMVNVKRQVKQLELRHIIENIPEEYSKFPVFMVPKNQNMDFYGRDDELQRINHYLDPKGANLLRTYTIYGRRGVGKTDIALQYAYTNPARFDAIFWIACETSITLRQSFTDMAVALNLPSADRNGHHEENQLAVQKWLKTTNRTWLMIFDNAERETILRGYWPVGASGAILITSRKYYNFMFDAQRRGDTIKPFTELQSWDLLMKLLGKEWQEKDKNAQMRHTDYRAAKDLLKSLDGLALAIQQAAQLINNPEIGGTTIESTYVSFLRHKDTLPDRQSGPRSDIVKSLDTLWHMTFSYLSVGARDLLSVLSLLSPDEILIDLFLPRNQSALDGKLAFCKQDPSSQATLSNVIRAPHQLQAAIDELLRFKLIKREGRVIWAHRVVQEAMNYHSFSELQDYFNSACALVYEAFAKQLNGDYLTKEQRSACMSYISHAAHLSFQFARYRRTEAQEAIKGSDEFVKLLYNASWYLYEEGDYDLCLRVVETAFMACQEKQTLQYATLCNVAGCAMSELNRQGECRRYWEIFSEIQDDKLPDDNLDRSASYHNMGNLECATGNLDEALEYFTNAIGIRSRAGDTAASLLANSYLCLSRVHFLRGEYEKAFNLLGESESLFFRIAGPDAHFMAHVHYAYGNIDFAQKKWTAAKRCYEASLRIGLATAPIHPITAAAYYSLGCVEFEMKHHGKAKGFLDKALAIAQLRSPSRDDGTVARILWKTSLILDDDVTGSYRLEAADMRNRAEIALRKLTAKGEGLVVTIDEDGNADAAETEEAYDGLVPIFFR